MLLEIMHIVVLLAGAAMLATSALAVWRIHQRSLPKLETALDEAQHLLDKAGPAVERIDGVASEVHGVLRPVRQGVEKVQSLIDGKGAPVAAGQLAAAVVPKLAQRAAAGPAKAAGAVAAGVPWQANAGVALGVVQVGLQAATLWYVKGRFDQLADHLHAMEAQLRAAVDLGNRMHIVQLTKPLRDARARLNLVAAAAAGQVGQHVYLARQDLLFVIHQLASGAEQLQALAGMLDPHHLLAEPRLVETAAAHLHDAAEIARALASATDPEVAAKARRVEVGVAEALQAWRNRLSAPVAQRGRIAAGACALKGRDLNALRADLAGRLAAPA